MVPTTTHLVSRTMAPRRKNATKHSSPTASQSEGHNASKSRSFEVQITTTIEEHSLRTTRSQTARGILLNTPSQFEEEGSSSGSGEESGSQSEDDSGGSAESESGSQEDATISPPAVGPEATTGAQTQAGAEEGDDEVTPDDTMVQYVHLHEFDPIVRQLIDCFRSMWTVTRLEDFFNNGIVNKSGGFRNRPLMPKVGNGTRRYRYRFRSVIGFVSIPNSTDSIRYCAGPGGVTGRKLGFTGPFRFG
ncbi:hypothetical protein KY290_024765 [Solanum tuberosum]|uniref:Integrase core domain containing protein n=1 Tax=Solanum tuberosum TaxID=4113 RepID=A0ABQ7UUR0_SOLTU|nr:hypothetical protein KY290_024765 [Solanum tuberosum]